MRVALAAGACSRMLAHARSCSLMLAHARSCSLAGSTPPDASPPLLTLLSTRPLPSSLFPLTSSPLLPVSYTHLTLPTICSV
eukprot:509439-Rhodomonas_salina.1